MLIDNYGEDVKKPRLPDVGRVSKDLFHNTATFSNLYQHDGDL